MRALLLLIAAAPAWAGLVQITDTLKTPMAGLFNGKVVVALAGTTAQPLYNSSGDTLTGWETSVTVTDGVFSLQLEANDTITPVGTSYRVRMIPSNGTKETLENWVVTTSGSPVKVATLRRTVVPNPTVTLTASQFVMAAGSLLYGASNGYGAALGIGSANQVLGISGGLPAWLSTLSGLAAVSIGANASSGDDSGLLIRRAATNPLSTYGSHGVRDESTYIPSGIGGYASFDAIPVFSGGTAPNNHLRGFQSRPNYSGSVSIDEVAAFHAQATQSGAGTASVVIGLRINDALGSGIITNQYGVWCDPLTRGASNYCFYSGSASLPSYHGGLYQFGTAPKISAAGFTTYGAFLTHDASGNLLTNPNLTIVNGVLKFGSAVANIQFGGATSSFPMLKRSTTTLQVRLADDSADANLSAATFTGALAGNASTATALSASVTSGRLWIGQGTGAPTSSATLCGDTTNARIGIGTCSPSAPLEISVASGNPTHFRLSNGGNTGSDYAAFDFLQGGSQKAVIYTNSNNLTVNVASGSMTLSPSTQLVFTVNASERARFAATSGNFLNGTPTDLGFGLHAANKGTNGNFLCYDPTATTGTTNCVFRAGPGQSGTVLKIQTNAGQNVGYWDGTGALGVTGSIIGITGDLQIDSASGGAFLLRPSGVEKLRLASASLQLPGTSFLIALSNDGTPYGTKDLSLSRSAANVLQVGDGGANANGTLLLSVVQFQSATEPTCNASNRFKSVAVAGGAAVKDTYRICTKDAADAYAWRTIY